VDGRGRRASAQGARWRRGGRAARPDFAAKTIQPTVCVDSIVIVVMNPVHP
jgi:hypothetical protein